MFEFVRRHTKWIMVIMFVLTIPAFLLVGVDGFRSMGNGGESVAKVGSHNIKQSDWDFAHKNEVDRMRAQMPNVDPKLLDSPVARYATLEKLVRERVMIEAVQSAHLTTTDAALMRALKSDPQIASLIKPDGSLDMAAYRQLAARQGQTPEAFEAQVRNGLAQRQVEYGIAGTAVAPSALANVTLNAFYEKREVQLARFDAKDYAAQVQPTDADIEAYYQANGSLFQAPEMASVEYLVLDMDSVKKTITVSDADLKAYYADNVARLSGKEERNASHILINAPKDMPAAERDKAKARAQELLAEVRKAPKTFADVARKNSQDAGSAPAGGSLGFFAAGAMVKPFSDAVFAMKPDEISDIVESDYGFHIIKLNEIKAVKQKSFEELRAAIETELKNQQSTRKFAEIAETFTNGVYEGADQLKPIAAKLNLEVHSASGVRRTPAPGATGPLANAKLLAALFSADSIAKKNNTDAVSIGANQLASARITEYSAAHTLPLAEVRAQVRERLVASRAAELAKKDGAAKLAAKDAKLQEAVVLSRDKGQTVPPQVLEAVMRADTATLPAWVGIDLGGQGYALARINKVLPRDEVPEQVAAQQRNQIAQLLAGAESQAYYELLKERFKVKISVPKPSVASLTEAANP